METKCLRVCVHLIAMHEKVLLHWIELASPDLGAFLSLRHRLAQVPHDGGTWLKEEVFACCQPAPVFLWKVRQRVQGIRYF